MGQSKLPGGAAGLAGGVIVYLLASAWPSLLPVGVSPKHLIVPFVHREARAVRRETPCCAALRSTSLVFAGI